jgi:hypothetical protein
VWSKNIFAAVGTGRAKTGIHISDASINTARFHSFTPLLDDNTDSKGSETDLQLNEKSKPWQGVPGKPHIHEVLCFVEKRGLGRNLYRLRHTSNREDPN